MEQKLAWMKLLLLIAGGVATGMPYEREDAGRPLPPSSESIVCNASEKLCHNGCRLPEAWSVNYMECIQTTGCNHDEDCYGHFPHTSCARPSNSTSPEQNHCVCGPNHTQVDEQILQCFPIITRGKLADDGGLLEYMLAVIIFALVGIVLIALWIYDWIKERQDAARLRDDYRDADMEVLNNAIAQLGTEMYHQQLRNHRGRTILDVD